jgi:hypothetical protein
MKINRAEAMLAGELTNQVEWTDDELKKIIVFERLVVAFLEGKGPKWHLAKAPLRMELNQFQSFAEARSRDS